MTHKFDPSRRQAIKLLATGVSVLSVQKFLFADAVLRAVEQAGRPAALKFNLFEFQRHRDGGDRGTGGRGCAGEAKATGLERGRSGGAGEGGPGETEAGRSSAEENDRYRQMDRPTPEHGNLDTPQPPAILAAPRNHTMTMKCTNTTILGADPLTASVRSAWRH